MRWTVSIVSIVSISVSALLATGCGGASDGSCAEAANHLAACMGDGVASAYAEGSCNPDTAARLLSQDCDGVRRTLLNPGKADQLDEAVKEAVRNAIREAVMQALEQAWQQVLGTLGLGLSERPIYLQFSTSHSKSKAEERAAELAQALAADPDFQPIAVKVGTFKWAVLHGPCPLDPGSDLPRKVADLVMENPELIKVLGGSIDVEHTEEGATVKMHLPLTLLSFGKDTPASLGCGESASPDPYEPEPPHEPDPWEEP
jgi:hypothetical protein